MEGLQQTERGGGNSIPGKRNGLSKKDWSGTKLSTVLENTEESNLAWKQTTEMELAENKMEKDSWVHNLEIPEGQAEYSFKKKKEVHRMISHLAYLHRKGYYGCFGLEYFIWN